MKTVNLPIIEGFDIYYNFIRPHMGISNLTPSEKANVNLNLNQNKWLSLLKEALNHHREINTEKQHP